MYSGCCSCLCGCLADREHFKSILFHKPITYLIDVPLYWATYKMMGLMHPDAAGPHDPLPSMSTILIQLLIHLFSYDLCFYSFHRLLHTKRFFPYHKKHHQLKVKDIA